MNSRKAARAVPATMGRFLKSGAMLKQPPPSFYPLLAHPPPPSLVRAFPARPDSDLPRAAHANTASASLYEQAKRKLDAGAALSPAEQQALQQPAQSLKQTRRKPPRPAGTKNPRPREIVFPEDEVRRLFFLDHPFEAYRAVTLVEGEKVREMHGPTGADWTELSQRSIVPTAEDCIAYVTNLIEAHHLPLASAYPHGIAQFRTLRAEHETATRSARLEAQSFGATFFGEIERAVQVEERVLDEWVDARAIQDEFAAANAAGAAAGAAAASASSSAAAAATAQAQALNGGGVTWLAPPAKTAATSLAASNEDFEGTFTGGLGYVEQFSAASATVGGAAEVQQEVPVGARA
ncbi:hypothetical protein JCM10908_004119 [Rhodotorula pacifica]|uniref:mitochondrial 37S ribosomal protein mS23 RSM25 n=1 Tax=Rhodotorula pacifica TaxID=1495444 RepID=UPI0031706EC0